MICEEQKPIEVIVYRKLRLLHVLIRLAVKEDKEYRLMGLDLAIHNGLIVGKMTYEEADALLDKLLLRFDKYKEALIDQLFEACDELFK